jgi:hypothetical protein
VVIVAAVVVAVIRGDRPGTTPTARAGAPATSAAPAPTVAATAPPATSAASSALPSPAPSTATPAVPSGLPGGVVPLVVAVASHEDTYDRSRFGSGWVDADHDCQDTRAEVLVTESRAPVSFTTTADCTVAAGDWIDPWSGAENMSARALDIDHTVPLANAWRSGAWAWTPEQRVAYANTLDFADHLVAIPLGENRAKGDEGPESWRPPSRAAWCLYAHDWTVIKARWNLTASPQEWNAILEMAATC